MAATTLSDRGRRGMRMGILAVATTVLLAACADDTVLGPGNPGGGSAAPPLDVQAAYYAGAVTVSWELASGWNGETFRVFGKRLADADFTFIAEVTSCAQGVCAYRDRNIVAGITYEYYVASVAADGSETASDFSVDVAVPDFNAPPSPSGMEVVALDGANYLRWADGSRAADDFSFYRVYLDDGAGGSFLLGETDSEGFLDELAENGGTYGYFVTAVDQWGHESGGSGVGEGTPRPDFTGEWIYAYEDRPGAAGFRFQLDEGTDPVLDGGSADRHFRLELDAAGWWLVPGPGTAIYGDGFATTALRCGPGADAGCVDVDVAPASGYTMQDVQLSTQTSYVLEVVGDDDRLHYAVIRVELLGFDQNDDAIMIFDWAYQTQADNPNLSPVTGIPLARAH